MTRNALVAALMVALAVAGLGACTTEDRRREPDPASSPAPTTGTARELPPGIDATVVSVTDGDTIVVDTAAGVTERVRLIGIDTPETRDPRRPVECFGREAAARTAELAGPGTPVRLELDVEHRDRYGRLLAYVWTTEGVFVNARLVEEGWAAPYRYPPNVRYADLLSRLGTEARVGGRGLWSACGGTDTPAAP